MPAAAVTRTSPLRAVRLSRELVLAAARWSALGIAVVLSTAGAVWLLAPADWQRFIYDEQHTDATVVQWLAIWLTNFVICSLPLLGGALGHTYQRANRTRRTAAILIVADLLVLRSPVIIGLVGGLDPAWLAGAAPWWLLEVACLGLCVAAGWLARRCPDGEQATACLIAAGLCSAVTLAVAALVEVALT